MNNWIKIESDEEGNLYNDLEMSNSSHTVSKPYLLVASSWKHADTGVFDYNYLAWYSPVDGSEFYPEPTHYMELPVFNDE